MHERLIRRLADHYGLGASQVALASSGTTALVALVLATAGRASPDRPLCVCPSFTFPATAAAVELSGYTPYLADIDQQTWMLDPERVAMLPRIHEVGAVIVVAAFGRRIDLASWQRFTDRYGVPVIVDAAASFDTISGSDISGVRLPVAISLHATKTFSSAEGGLMLCSDADLISRAVAATNFGFCGKRISEVASINGKLSEYHAIVGHADLDGWSHKRAGFLKTAVQYLQVAAGARIEGSLLVNCLHATPYALYLARDAEEAAAIMAALDTFGIESRMWYGAGLHAQPAFENVPRDAMWATQDLASRLIGLPFSVDLGFDDIIRIVDIVAHAVSLPRIEAAE